MVNTANILYLTCTPSRGIVEAHCRLKKEGIDFNLKLIYPLDLWEGKIDDKGLFSLMKNSQAIILDLRGTTHEIEEVLAKQADNKIILAPPFASAIMPYIRLGRFTMKNFVSADKDRSSFEIDNPQGFMKWVKRAQNFVEKAGRFIPSHWVQDARNYIIFTKYLYNGGVENYENMFKLVLSYLGYNGLKPRSVQEGKENGIFDPEFGFFSTKEEYFKIAGRDSSKPTLGVLFFGGMHLDQYVDILQGLKKEFSNYNLLPVYTDGFTTISAIRKFFFDQNKPLIDGLLNLLWFRINGGPLGGNPAPTIEILNELNVPVFNPVLMFMKKISDWEKSDQGLDIVETIASITWPELDGATDPVPICGLEDGFLEGISFREVKPIEERLDRFTARIKRRIFLHQKPNQEKKVALIIYNYPPGEADIGSASYLDTFASLERILDYLKSKGYRVEKQEKSLKELFLDFHLVNSGRWLSPQKIAQRGFYLSCEEYKDYFYSLPQKVQEEVVKSWGNPPGKVMVFENKILIPAIEFGNILIGIQPARPPLRNGDDLNKIAHNRSIPPHHQYLAFYYWLKEVWKTDAVVHIGTHGLVEFMPGKELAPAEGDFPDLLIGDLPHFYYYIISNPSEATIAKRRAYATLISHNSPAYVEAGLYEQYQELEDLLEEYQQFSAQPERVKPIQDRIKKLADELNLENYSLSELHDELYKIKRLIIPYGLHIIGDECTWEQKKNFLKALLSYDREGIKSLNSIFSQGFELDLNRQGHKKEISQKIEKVIEMALSQGAEYASTNSGLSFSLKKELFSSLDFGLKVLGDYCANERELESLANALSGGYIEPSSAGDILRNPDALPTGRNIFQFDPTKIPTELALLRGREAGENTLKRYIASKGRYPESVGVVLWGFETTGTGGETIGQILYYLGLRLNRKHGAWDPRLEVIPLEELKRPRIDVLVNICGFFREMFPQQMELVARAFKLVSELDEPDEWNFVKKHSQENLKLIKQKIKISENSDFAWKLACARIFGPQSGEYGTKMLPLIEDSVWNKEEELAQSYLDSMCFLHSENIFARYAKELYKQNLKNVKLVSQIIYSNDYDLIDLDHYYEFFGGLARSVEMISNEAPLMLFSDTRREGVETESAEKLLDRSIRSRLLNPKWIEGIMAHNWHGAQKIADRVEYLIGWSATTHSVSSWTYQKVAERFVFDEKIRRELTQSNSFATHQIIERLIEAYQRGYWKATQKDLRKLEESLLEIEAEIEQKTD